MNNKLNKKKIFHKKKKKLKNKHLIKKQIHFLIKLTMQKKEINLKKTLKIRFNNKKILIIKNKLHKNKLYKNLNKLKKNLII